MFIFLCALFKMPKNINDTLADIFPDGSVVFRDISEKSICGSEYRAMMFCFDMKAKNVAFTTDCKHFIKQWDACLKKNHLPHKPDKLDKSS